MKIVIKIPDLDYFDIKHGYADNYQKERLVESVKRSIAIPKGHGRLGDLDALEMEIDNGIRAGNYEEGYENYGHINDMDDCLETVRFAETIIEADKEVDNG